MKIALVAPSHVPFVVGGAEKMWWRLHRFINENTSHDAEIIRLPSPEADFWAVVNSYRLWATLSLDHFDMVISGKYPSWMLQHRNHVVWQIHCLRGLYDTYHHFENLPKSYPTIAPSVSRLVEHMRQTAGERDALDEFFARLDEVRAAPDLPSELFIFPGPFLRDIVHYLDGIGLGRGAITRYATISETVRKRIGYRPKGVTPEVALIPSSLDALSFGRGQHFLIVSRLERPKRIDFGINGIKQTNTNLPLKIVGTGPDEEWYKSVAENDPRIEFLGFVNDEELARLYRDAVAVIFTPFDEDFGIITCEAMLAGKVVVTVSDAGGPNELVRNGVNGYSVEPTPDAIAKVLDSISEDLEAATTMGRRAHFDAREVTWDHVASVLLDEPVLPQPKPIDLPQTRKPRLVVANTFACYPPEGGGQARHFYLLQEASRDFDITYVALVHESEDERIDVINDSFRQIRIPKSARHASVEASYSEQLDWVPVTDVVAPILHHLTPRYRDVLQAAANQADLLGAFHPFLVGALEEVSDKPIWHDCANIEASLKADILPNGNVAKDLVRLTAQVERIAMRKSSLITVCSEGDAEALPGLYGISDKAIAIVENGVDLRSTPFISMDDRSLRRHALNKALRLQGLEDKELALFIASWHEPNILAAKKILEIADGNTRYVFLIAGSVGGYFKDQILPENVCFLDIVSIPEKAALLAACDIAVNPVPFGSGTNVKMFDYFSAGIPVVTTPAGSRGLTGFAAGRDYVEAAFETFEAGMDKLSDLTVEKRSEMVQHARTTVETQYAWSNLYKKLRASRFGL